MSKYLITGVSGFVGEHMVAYLDEQTERSEILGLDLVAPRYSPPARRASLRLEQVDTTDRERVGHLVASFMPDHVVHLAAHSSVAFSWQQPATCVLNNTATFLSVAEAIRIHVATCRLLLVGSSEAYGAGMVTGRPFVEEDELHPNSPYAVARVTQEGMMRLYERYYELDIVATRSFNHIGTHQNERFAVPSFVKQLCEAKRRGDHTARLLCGNVDLMRDFADVRDVVRAYTMLLQRGKRGEVYNVCQGEGFSLRDVIHRIAAILDIGVDIQVNPRLLRQSDIPQIIGSREKMQRDIGWEPRYALDDTLRSMVAETLR